MKSTPLFGALLLVVFAAGGVLPVFAEGEANLKTDTRTEFKSWLHLPLFAPGNKISVEAKAAAEANVEKREKKEVRRALATDIRGELKSDHMLLKAKATATKEKIKEHAKEDWMHAPGFWKRFALMLGFNAGTTTEDNPLVLKVKAATTGVSSVHLFWTTDEKTKTVVYYTASSTASVASTTPSLVDSKFRYFHHVKLPNLSADTTYHYRIVATDKDGSVSTSNDFTFKTDVN